jgi:hypothetical protein
VGEDLHMCNLVSPASSAGFVILLHWSRDRVVAVRGYSSVFQMVDRRINHASICFRLPALICDAYFCDSPSSHSYSAVLPPSGAVITPSVFLPLCTSSRLNVMRSCLEFRTKIYALQHVLHAAVFPCPT